MVQVRQLIGDMESREQRLLEKRSEQKRAAAWETTVALFVGSLIAGIVFSGIFLVLQGEITTRKRLTEQLQQRSELLGLLNSMGTA